MSVKTVGKGLGIYGLTEKQSTEQEEICPLKEKPSLKFKRSRVHINGTLFLGLSPS